MTTGAESSKAVITKATFNVLIQKLTAALKKMFRFSYNTDILCIQMNLNTSVMNWQLVQAEWVSKWIYECGLLTRIGQIYIFIMSSFKFFPGIMLTTLYCLPL